MKNAIVERKLNDFIHEYSVSTRSAYWVPLVKLKKDIQFSAFDLVKIYENNDIALLENVFKACGILDVSFFQMDHSEYFEHENIFELLCDKDEFGWSFPRCVEAFYFDSFKKWLVYVSHEGTISFTGKEISEAAIKYIDESYRCKIFKPEKY